MTVLDELASLPERIKTSSERLVDLLELAAAEMEIRNELIVQAVDEAGLTQAQVGRAAGLSQPQINRILASSSSVD